MGNYGFGGGRGGGRSPLSTPPPTTKPKTFWHTDPQPIPFPKPTPHPNPDPFPVKPPMPGPTSHIVGDGAGYMRQFQGTGRGLGRPRPFPQPGPPKPIGGIIVGPEDPRPRPDRGIVVGPEDPRPPKPTPHPSPDPFPMPLAHALMGPGSSTYDPSVVGQDWRKSMSQTSGPSRQQGGMQSGPIGGIGSGAGGTSPIPSRAQMMANTQSGTPPTGGPATAPTVPNPPTAATPAAASPTKKSGSAPAATPAAINWTTGEGTNRIGNRRGRNQDDAIDPDADNSNPFFNSGYSYGRDYSRGDRGTDDKIEEQVPIGTWERFLSRNGMGGFDRQADFGRAMYDRARAGFQAAQVNNGNLRFEDYVKRYLNGDMLRNAYLSLDPDARGADGATRASVIRNG
jgi:hypothetical protein